MKILSSVLTLCALFSFLFPLEVTHAAVLPELSFPIVSTLIPASQPVPSAAVLAFFTKFKLPNNSLTELLALFKQPSCMATTQPAASAPSTNTAITFSNDTRNHWQFTAGYNNGPEVMAYADAAGDSAFALAADPADSDIPVTSNIEALVINTGGKYVSDSCNSKVTYTGNPSTDFACYIQESTAQGYKYVVGTQAATTGT